MNERDTRLRAVLRAADPAARMPELADAEVERIRRAALRALPVRPPRVVMAPAWALAIAVAAVAFLALGLVAALRLAGPPRTPDGVGVRDAREQAPPPAARSAPVVEPEPRREVAAVAPRTQRSGPRVARSAAPSPAPTAAATVEAIATASREPEPVQLRLTAPGGTRIVWVLGPPTSGR